MPIATKHHHILTDPLGIDAADLYLGPCLCPVWPALAVAGM
jgi:hypothetical protein